VGRWFDSGDTPVRDFKIESGARAAVFAVAVTALAYIGTLRNEFVFDDFLQIVNNPLLRSWHSLPGFFIHQVWSQVFPHSVGGFYRPLFMAWLLVQFKAFALKTVAWHAATVAVHLLVTYQVFLLAKKVMREEFAAGAAALLFGLHPVHVESVAWISGVSDPLMAAWFLGAVLCWMRYRESGSRKAGGGGSWLAGSLLLAAAALMTKETAVVLPGVIAAWEWWLSPEEGEGREGGAREWTNRTTVSAVESVGVKSAPFVALDVVYLVVRRLVLGSMGLVQTPVPMKVMALTWPSLLWFYVRHMVWPVGLSAFYETPYVNSATLRGFWMPLAAVAMVLAGLWMCARASRSGVVGFACALMVLPLVPALDLRAFQYAELAHDRYLYLPSVGFALLLGYGFSRLHTRFNGRWKFASVAVMVVAGCFAALTAIQSEAWANTLTLYTHAYKTAPGNVNAVVPLAKELLRRGDQELAVPLLYRTTELEPGVWQNYFVLGETLYQLHRCGEAEKALQQAIAIEGKNAAQFYFLGMCRLESGDAKGAEGPLRRAVEMQPNVAGLHEALARALAVEGDRAGARSELELELKIDPQNADARKMLAEMGPRRR